MIVTIGKLAAARAVVRCIRAVLLAVLQSYHIIVSITKRL